MAGSALKRLLAEYKRKCTLVYQEYLSIALVNLFHRANKESTRGNCCRYVKHSGI